MNELENKGIDKHYLAIEQRINEINHERESDKQLQKLKRLAEIIDKKISAKESAYEAKLKPLIEQRDAIIAQLKTMYRGHGTKHYGVLVLHFRKSRSLKIVDKEVLIRDLHRINKLSQCVKSFDNRELRKLADANVISGIEFEERINLNVEVNRNE